MPCSATPSRSGGPGWRTRSAATASSSTTESDEAALDAAVGNWRALLKRFAEDHARVYLRPDATANAELRRLAAEACASAPSLLGRSLWLGSPQPTWASLAGWSGSRRGRAPSTGCSTRLGRDAVVVGSLAELSRVGLASEAVDVAFVRDEVELASRALAERREAAHVEGLAPHAGRLAVDDRRLQTLPEQ